MYGLYLLHAACVIAMNAMYELDPHLMAVILYQMFFVAGGRHNDCTCAVSVHAYSPVYLQPTMQPNCLPKPCPHKSDDISCLECNPWTRFSEVVTWYQQMSVFVWVIQSLQWFVQLPANSEERRLLIYLHSSTHRTTRDVHVFKANIPAAENVMVTLVTLPVRNIGRRGTADRKQSSCHSGPGPPFSSRPSLR